ncbi:MAG: MlaD family protein [Thermoleophilaceae bacterium]
MQKQTPGLSGIAAMVGFTLSVFGLLLFLWISFGGSIPLRPEGYRVTVPLPEAAVLVEEADVRVSGINVGKVKATELQKRPPRTLATLEIESRYAPLPAGTRAILRQKTILGETYVELTPSTDEGEAIDDGGNLPEANVRPTVEFDELFSAFDPETREAFERWQEELAKSVDGGGGRDLNESLANLPGFAEAGADVLEILDRREQALGRFVRNTGVVFEALSERDLIAELIVNSNRLFETTAARDDALAETISVFPTFLDESRTTLARLETFARDTQPLVEDLQPVTRELTPTLASVADLSPDLEDLFRDVDALNEVAPDTFPDARRFLSGAEPVLEALNPFLFELNPILSYLNFQAPQVADFITVGGAALANTLNRGGDEGHPRHVLRQVGLINQTSLSGMNATRPAGERANAYLAPNAQNRRREAGILESFDCSHIGGEQPNPSDGSPPCLVEPPSLWDNNTFTTIEQGEAPVVPPPLGNEGTQTVPTGPPG